MSDFSLLSVHKISPLLLELGFPKFNSDWSAMTALHAGAACHRLAVISESVNNYLSQADMGKDELEYLQLLSIDKDFENARMFAERYYQDALNLDDSLAEAWFAIARIFHQDKRLTEALTAYKRTLILQPHPKAPTSAQLHANANWHMATIYEDIGNESLALVYYREAISKCNCFGVHHKRYAVLLRRLGYIEDAMNEFEKMMVYNHRYFTEFLLPPLYPIETQVVNEYLDIIFETTTGHLVFFWDNLYWKLNKKSLPVSTSKLMRLKELHGTSFLSRHLIVKLYSWIRNGNIEIDSSIVGLEDLKIKK